MQHRPRVAGEQSGANPRVVLRAFRELAVAARRAAPTVGRRPDMEAARERRGAARAGRPRRRVRPPRCSSAISRSRPRCGLVASARSPPNPFYDAAVRSMRLSWHNFFFGAFEPGGERRRSTSRRVDLWLQVASVKLLGFASTR